MSASRNNPRRPWKAKLTYDRPTGRMIGMWPLKGEVRFSCYRTYATEAAREKAVANWPGLVAVVRFDPGQPANDQGKESTDGCPTPNR